MLLICRAMTPGLRCLLIFVTLLINAPPRLWAATHIVAQTGDNSPDGNGELDWFFAPTINAAGQVVFASQLTGTTGGSADNGALYRGDTSGVLTKIARGGEPFEGKTLSPYFFVYPNYISANGTVSALAFFSEGGSAYVHGNGGALTRSVPTGMPSPSGQSNTLLGVNNLVTNDSGVMVYRAVFNGSQPESGLYQRTSDGTHSVRLLSQTTAPRGGTITSTGHPSINELNQIGTLLTINTGTNIRSAALIDGTTVHELVRQGDLLPDGVTTVGQFPSTQSFGFVNSAGQVAFAANVTRPGYGGQGVILADTTTASCVATGVLPGSTSAANNMQVVGITDASQVAFTAEFGGGFDPSSGIYLAGTSGVTLVAFEDTATPVPGKYIRGFLSDGSTVNNAGQVAFIADLSDTVNGASSGNGIFFYDETGGLQQVARTGDSLDGSTITSVFFYGTMTSTIAVSPETSATGLNSLGQVAFAYSLADGTDGVAIWTPPAGVPGDYSNNGTVDAADYVLWRKGGVLANEVDTPGTLNAADYTAWRARFGNVGSGSGGGIDAHAAIPEPSTIALMIPVVAGAFIRRHRDGRGLSKVGSARHNLTGFAVSGTEFQRELLLSGAHVEPTGKH